ncbi:MAG: hypothetical protein L0Y71_15835 [Gemmataceae bacterium]|nr:hypothetical protein [Gemmataceae bacterium]
MRKLQGYNLWPGNAREARDSRAVLDAGIAAVVDLAVEEKPAALVRELIYCRLPLYDGAGNPPWLLRVAATTVAALIRAGVPTLVACGAGMSRSPLVAAGAVATVRGNTLTESVDLVLPLGAGDVSPALLADMTEALAGKSQDE